MDCMKKKKNNNKTSFFTALIFLGVLVPLMTACSLDRPTNLSLKRVELKTDTYERTLSTKQVKDDVIRVMGEHYRHYGEGPLNVVVTYDPESKSSTAMKATDHAVKIATGLRKSGVTEIKTGILPVKGQGNESETTFAYDIVKAYAPEGCESMGGMDGKQTQANKEYSYGCSIEMLLAKQIARPADLAGRSTLSSGDGRRQTNISERYRVGEPNTPLDGESVTAQ